jgi:hypothetical protein
MTQARDDAGLDRQHARRAARRRYRGRGKLQQAGLIRYNRGHITVLDRARLEARTCECYAVVKYAVVKKEYHRLLQQSSAM